MWRSSLGDDPRVRAWASRLGSQPGWAFKAALLAAALVVLVPLALLTLAALVFGAMVFVALAAAAWAVGLLRRLLGGRGAVAGWREPDDDGRRNVRVIDR